MMTVAQALELALWHHQAGRLADAEAIYRQILAVQPSNADARHLLGVTAYQGGRHDLAVEWIRQAVAIEPANAAAHSNLGEAYRAQGRVDEAVAAYRRALALEPDYPEAHNNLGIALAEQGEIEEAIAACRRAVELRPDFARAYYNLGNALKECGRLEEAMAAYRRALDLKPDFAEAHSNLGIAFKEGGHFEEAIAAYHRALECKPDYAKAHSNLGVALAEQGKLEEAVAAYQHALHHEPRLPETHNNLGNALREKGHLDEAAVAIRRAIELKPDLADAHNNLGNVWKDQGRLDEAIAAYREALRLRPERVDLHSNLIYALHFHADQDRGTIAEEQARWNGRFSEPAKRLVAAHSNDRDPERPLRVGYVSADLRDHVIGRNLLPLFRHHDRRAWQMFCYAGVARPDHLTREFREHADRWRSTIGVADEALADMIAEDGVDVLVDLAQHTAGNRLAVFARQPAPVQVSFAGYPESAGVEAIGYRISDRYLDAEGKSCSGREHVFPIDSFWCYDPCGASLEVNNLPAKESGRITFGSLNNFCKVNEPLLRLWGRVLRDVRESSLIMLSGLGSHRQQTLELLEREGVQPQRVEFVESRSRKAYLELYHRLDLILDTFPYNGHTTSLDALWMGVPVVSLAGQSAVSRAGLSQLSNLGLPELVAKSENEYVSIATRLARDLPRLEDLRRTLRPRMEASVLMDAPRFTRNIEAAFRALWRRWCEDQSGQR